MRPAEIYLQIGNVYRESVQNDGNVRKWCKSKSWHKKLMRWFVKMSASLLTSFIKISFKFQHYSLIKLTLFKFSDKTTKIQTWWFDSFLASERSSFNTLPAKNDYFQSGVILYHDNARFRGKLPDFSILKVSSFSKV